MSDQPRPKILIVYRHFHPDTPPYASMLKDMTRWLAQAGYDVEVFTSQPSYKSTVDIEAQPARETIDGVTVIRQRMLPEGGRQWVKALNSVWFVASSALRVLLQPKRDLVWTATQPPILQGIMLSIAARLRGSRFLYHMQDIHPEISYAMAGRKPGALARLLVWVDTMTNRLATVNVVLGKDMRDALLERGVGEASIACLNNFSLITSDAVAISPREKRATKAPVRFIFAGNIGRFQNLLPLVEAFAKLDPETATLTMMGTGKLRAQIETYLADGKATNIELLDHVPVEEAFRTIARHDVGIVSLAPGIYRYAFPSKLWTYMAAGVFNLAFVEDDSEIAGLLRESRLGTSINWQAEGTDLTQKLRDVVDMVRGSDIDPSSHRDLYHPSAAEQRWLDLVGEILSVSGDRP